MNDDYTDTYYELRYLTLELMKLSYRKGKPFRKVAKEYIRNLQYLYELIDRMQR
ncbi:MAG: hypothetical protein NZ908_02385 [Candidatus Micrarchaeota archaeon]|nr:hypothetical protein [Candidatus Micrarchaeota archaeon]MCX8154729.1 hypothetical protein [Candidatus Micrarchaeota archaeon]